VDNALEYTISYLCNQIKGTKTGIYKDQLLSSYLKNSCEKEFNTAKVEPKEKEKRKQEKPSMALFPPLSTMN